MHFSNIVNFSNEVKKEIEEECPLNLKQVEAFLDNYLCERTSFISFKIIDVPIEYSILAVKTENVDIPNNASPDEVKTRLFLPSIDNAISTSSAKLSPQISYIDEDNDLKFINSNTNPLNTSEQTVYVVSNRLFIKLSLL